MKIKSIAPIEPTAARCIEVDSSERLFLIKGDNGAQLVTHNSVSQNNIVIGCVLRPDSWRFLGVDLKKVELSPLRAYSNVVLGIATTIEDALTVLRFAQTTMMKRYAELEQLGLNDFLDLPEKGQALLVMVDEAGELLGSSGVKALTESTPVILANGEMTTMGDVQLGMDIQGLSGEPVTVVDKYEPEEQGVYNLTITRDSDSVSEDVVSGAEHHWVAYFESPDGQIRGPETVDTQFLFNLREAQLLLPEAERTKVKFRRNIID